MNQPLRITILSNTKGGVGSFTTTLAQGLRNRHCTLNILFLSQTQTQKSSHSNALLIGSVPNLWSLLKFLLINDSDILQVNFASLFPLAFWKKLIFKTPYVLTLHGLPQPYLENTIKNKIAYTIEQLLIPTAIQYSSTTVVVSNYTKSQLQMNYNLDATIIYHGINTKEIHKIEKKDAKRHFGFTEEDCVVLYVGVLNPYKNPLLLIDAFSKLAKAKDLYLLIVGTGELFKESEHAIECKGLQNNIKLLGRVSGEELAFCYSAADIFVLPTVNEAFGIVLLEAMAYGLPIIYSNSGACPEVVRDSGLFFKPGDCSDLAKRILQLKEDEELANRLAGKGIERVRSHFNLENQIEKYYTLLERSSKLK